MNIRHSALNAVDDLERAIFHLKIAIAHDQLLAVSSALSHIDTAQRELTLAKQSAQTLRKDCSDRMSKSQLLGAVEARKDRIAVAENNLAEVLKALRDMVALAHQLGAIDLETEAARTAIAKTEGQS